MPIDKKRSYLVERCSADDAAVLAGFIKVVEKFKLGKVSILYASELLVKIYEESHAGDIEERRRRALGRQGRLNTVLAGRHKPSADGP